MGLDTIDLTAEQRRAVQRLLDKHIPDVEVWAYGSRVKWTSTPISDLDLVVFTTPDQDFMVFNLRTAFEESDLPFRVDILMWNTMPSSFRSQVERDYVVLQHATTRKSGPSSGWRSTTWGELATLEYGKSLRNYRSSKGPYRVYGTNGPIGWNDEPLCTEASVIIGRKGAYRGVHYSSAPFYVIDTAFYLKPKVELDTRWAYYELLTHNINSMDSGSAIPSTSRSDFYNLPVRLPPLPGQRAIAHILGTIDDKIDLNERMCQTLEQMAQTLFKSWFVDFDPVRAKQEGRPHALPVDLADLFPDRLVDSELGPIPDGWELRTVGELASVVGGSTPSTKQLDYWRDGVHCWATPKDLSALNTTVLLDTERKITDSGLQQIGSGLLVPGTLLLSSRAPIGYLAVSEIPVAINQGFIGILVSKAVSNLFMLYWARMHMNQIVNFANGSTFLEISKQNFRKIPLVVPGETVMAAFGRVVRPVYERIVSNERQSRTLAAQRDALLPGLLSAGVGQQV